MLLKWILKLIGLGFLLGAGSRCGRGGEDGHDGERMRRARRRAAQRLHRIADAMVSEDGEERSQTPGE